MRPLQTLSTAAALCLAACSSGGSGLNAFSVVQTPQAADPSFPIVVGGDYVVFRAMEADQGSAGTDLDGDGTPDDLVTMVVDVDSQVVSSLNLRAEAAHVVGDQVFLVVDELLDGTDHGANAGATDLVLMRWSVDLLSDPVYVDELERAAPVRAVATAERLYYTAAAAPAASETNLRFVDLADPAVSLAVPTTVVAGLASGRLFGMRDQLVLATFNETVDGDLDGDGDGSDAFVLALVDGTDAAAQLFVTDLGLRGAGTPWDAEALDTDSDGTADNGWLVAVLADEIAEDADLNDPALFSVGWRPTQCPNLADGDKTDEVLQYLYFEHPTFATTTVNTGLVGRNRVVVSAGEVVATTSPEDEADCNLNQDADNGDLIARWCVAVDPALGSLGVLPPGGAASMEALSTGTPGGALGLLDVEGHLVALVDEAGDGQDHDGNPGLNNHLIAWLEDPAVDQLWDYDLVDPEGFVTTAGASWLGGEARLGRVGFGFQEASIAQNLNSGCNKVPKDGDTSDSVLGWLHYEAGAMRLPGLGYATDAFNVGATFVGGNVFFRVSEAGDDADYNGNGTKTDVILVRNPLGTVGCSPSALATLNGLVGDAVTSDGVRAAAFFTDEMDALVDVNKDGDQDDLVLRWLRFF